MDISEKILILDIAKEITVKCCGDERSVSEIYRELRDLVNEEPGSKPDDKDQAA